MPPTHSEAQGLSELVYRRFRRNALRAIVDAEEKLDVTFAELARALRAEAPNIGLDEVDVLELLWRAFRRIAPDREEAIREAIEKAAREGVDVAPALHRRIFGPDARAPEDERPFDRASDSPPTRRPSLRLVRGSGDPSTETG